jgi:cell division protein FtsW
MMLSNFKLPSLKLPGLKQPSATLAEYDTVLSWIVIALLALGMVMVYSSSIATAEASKSTGYQQDYLLRHGLYIFLGLLAGALVFQIPSEPGKTSHPICLCWACFC